MKLEFRADGAVEISGYVNAVERDSRVLPPIMASGMTTEFVEQIAAGAFDRSLQKYPNVKCKLNHGRDIADIEGGTLELHEDNIGLHARAVITDKETVSAARAGKLTGWSFGFNSDKATVTDSEKPNVKRRRVEELCLNEVSVLTQTPASVEYRRECVTKLEALKEQYGKATEKIKPDMPFGDWIDFWYQTYCKHTLRITTQGEYENRIYNHIIPEIGKIPLNKLTQSDLQQFYAKEKTSGRKLNSEILGKSLSDRTIHALHANCHTALKRATHDGLIRKNPADGCKLPPKKAREMQVLTQTEIMKFLHQAKEEGYYELFLLEFGTGMRRGEILGLKWSDLNFKTGELHIKRQVYVIKAEVITSTPKTKASIRTIILPPSLVNILSEYRKTVDSEWMFPSPYDNNKPKNPSAVRKRLQLILERAGCKKVRFHDLRHTFATMALEHGMDVKTLSATIGHVSSSTTLDIYSHITDTMKQQAAIRIDRKIGGTDAEMPQEKLEKSKDTTPIEFTQYKPKIRKSGTAV